MLPSPLHASLALLKFHLPITAPFIPWQRLLPTRKTTSRKTNLFVVTFHNRLYGFVFLFFLLSFAATLSAQHKL